MPIALELKGYSVNKTDDFLPLMKKCFDAGGIHLIDLPIDYSDSKKILIDELREKVCLI